MRAAADNEISVQIEQFKRMTEYEGEKREKVREGGKISGINVTCAFKIDNSA